MSINTASTARTIVTSTSTRRVVQVMSDIWEEFSFFTGTEIVDGKVVPFEEMCRGQEKPVVNATEADIALALKNLKRDLATDLSEMSFEMTGKVEDFLEVGALIKVVRGRKVPVGFTGTIAKMGLSQFGRWLLVIPTNGGEKVFVSASNVVVTCPLFSDAFGIANRTGKDFILGVTTLDVGARSGLVSAVKSALRSARWQKTNERREWVQKVARGF